MKHTNRILDRAASAMASTHRTDFSIVAATEISEGFAMCVATVGGSEPSHEDIQGWITASTDRKVSVMKDGMTFHRNTPHNFVSFVAKQNLLRRTVAECANDPGLQRISASTYFDQDLGVHWKKEDDDSEYLVRCQPDGIASVIASVTKHKGPKTQKRASQILAKAVYVGDIVEFILPDGTKGYGTVSKTGDGIATVKEKNTGNVYDRPCAAITEILNTSAQRRAGQQAENEIWEQIYGPGFASELTR